MVKRRRSGLSCNKMLRVLCAALMLSLGISHKPANAATHIEQLHLAEEYRLPDGTFAEICHTLHGDEGDHPSNHQSLRERCEACILASAILIPTTPDTTSLNRRLVAVVETW